MFLDLLQPFRTQNFCPVSTYYVVTVDNRRFLTVTGVDQTSQTFSFSNSQTLYTYIWIITWSTIESIRNEDLHLDMYYVYGVCIFVLRISIRVDVEVVRRGTTIFYSNGIVVWLCHRPKTEGHLIINSMFSYTKMVLRNKSHNEYRIRGDETIRVDNDIKDSCESVFACPDPEESQLGLVKMKVYNVRSQTIS